VGTTIFAEKIVILFYGSGFESSIIALRILIWASVIIYVNYVLTQLLIVINKQKFNAIFTILCAAFNIGLNLVFIPKLSYIGSGVITVGTEMLLFVLCFFAVSRCMGIIPLHRIIIKPVLASIILGLALIIVADAPLFLAILIAAVVYVGAVKLIRIIDKDDYDILKSIFKVKTYEVSEK
jgi:O-antigen/teichoic acid export membrane protein